MIGPTIINFSHNIKSPAKDSEEQLENNPASHVHYILA